MRNAPQWPVLDWSRDEVVCCALLQKGKASFFSGSNFTRALQTLNLPELRQVWLASSSGKEPYHVAAFTPGNSGRPGTLAVYRYPQLNKAIISRSFHADAASVSFNVLGNALLLQVSTDVDRTNQSYYGRTGLHVITIGEVNCSAVRVTDEAVHAAQWHPSGLEFAVIYGAMPDPRISVFDLKAKIVAELAEPEAPRNTLYYDPTGKVTLPMLSQHPFLSFLATLCGRLCLTQRGL